MGMPALEEYVAYVPKRDQNDIPASGTIDLAQLQVRVFNGNIQVYDGMGWIDMGAAQSYIEADPMAAGSGDSGSEGETVSSAIAAVYANRGGGQVAPKDTPKPTSKPANKPTAPVTPVAPVAPTTPVAPVPTQAPTAPANPDPAPPGNPNPSQPGNPNPPQPSNPDPAPQPTPEPAPTPAPTDPPITGGDSDVEWSPDMM